MHLRGQTTTFQTRLEISEHAAAGLNDPKLLSELDAPSGQFVGGPKMAKVRVSRFHFADGSPHYRPR